jgi:bifunctional enzyme CysN/CysC
MPRKNKGTDTSVFQARHQSAATIEEFLQHQQHQDLLRFITCGSVDDGKSTLIGRMLWESQQLFDDQLATLRTESVKYGTQGNDIDFALLVDGLAAEREQGITIDVAYRFFSTNKRKFIVADTPGHEQYTRNMVTGASTANVALLLIDARQGLLTQTRRHAYICSLMGIKHIVLAINKMDLVGFSLDIYNQTLAKFDTFSQSLGFESITAVPLSALNGDNITSRSVNTPWYRGPTLIGYLETVNVAAAQDSKFAFPVQWVNRPNSSFRGFSGSIAQGSIEVGQQIRVISSGQTAHISEIVTFDGSLQTCSEGDAITVTLDKNIDASRGDVICQADNPLETTDHFEATIIWMHEQNGLVGRNYEIKLSTQTAAASITNIKYRQDINTLNHEACTKLSLNDIAVCNITTNKPLAFERYQDSKPLGSFILIDRYTHATVAAGLIHHSLRRGQNIHKHALTITRNARERLNSHPSQVIWLTGLSGSGKSTIANALEISLHQQGKRTYILDGDNIRQGLNKDLGFTDADRVENIRRVAEVAKLMMDAGLIVITSFISPFKQEREMARELIGKDSFVEVYVNTPLEVCEQRDPKGLYKKARAGQLPNMTGIGSPYEAPADPEIKINGAQSVEDAVDTITLHLANHWIRKT